MSFNIVKLADTYITNFYQAEVERIRKAKQSKDGKHLKKKAKKENSTLLIPGEVIDLT